MCTEGLSWPITGTKISPFVYNLPICRNNILAINIMIKLLNNPIARCFYYEVDTCSVKLELTIVALSFHVLSPLSPAFHAYELF